MIDHISEFGLLSTTRAYALVFRDFVFRFRMSGLCSMAAGERSVTRLMFPCHKYLPLHVTRHDNTRELRFRRTAASEPVVGSNPTMHVSKFAPIQALLNIRDVLIYGNNVQTPCGPARTFVRVCLPSHLFTLISLMPPSPV